MALDWDWDWDWDWVGGPARLADRTELSCLLPFFLLSPSCLSELVLVFSFLILSLNLLYSLNWLIRLSISLSTVSLGKKELSPLPFFLLFTLLSFPSLSLLFNLPIIPLFFSFSHFFSLYSSLLLDGEKWSGLWRRCSYSIVGEGEKRIEFIYLSLSLSHFLSSLYLSRQAGWFNTDFNLAYSTPAGKPLPGEPVEKVPLSLRVQGIVPHSRMLVP